MSNIIDKIRLSGVTYDIQGTVEASSAITSGDTNPVEGGVLYDELRIPGEVESGLTLEWELYDGGSTTNYPSGQCSKIIFENIAATGETEGDTWYEPTNGFSFGDSEGFSIGYISLDVDNDGVITITNATNVTYSIDGNNLTVEYPSIAANVDHIYANNDNYWTTTAFVNASGMIPLINQVSANTISLSGKQDTLSAGTGISISGNVISASGGGNATVELTQAEYDALVSAGTVAEDTYYIITDAQSPDITQYWTSAQTQSAITQATSGKVNTSSVVSSVTSASTDSEIPTAKAVWDVASQGGGGGGTTYTAGRGIDITNDTISVSLPIYAGTGSNSIVANSTYNKATQANAMAIGDRTSATGTDTFAEGWHSKASGTYSHAEGRNTKANGAASHAEGMETVTNNYSEHASGQYNVSSSGSSTFGDSGNTLFSVGNGTADNARHNAFEIRQNGDMYLNNGTSDIKLQDYLQIKLVKLTQSAYDALSPNYDSNTLYVIVN